MNPKLMKYAATIACCDQIVKLYDNPFTKENELLDDDSMRLTITNNLNNCFLSYFRRWRIHKYLNKFNSFHNKYLLRDYLAETACFYHILLCDDTNLDSVEIKKAIAFFTNEKPLKFFLATNN